MASIAELWNNAIATSHSELDIDQIKKEIKDIKQKMKHANYYVEKLNLQRDLQDANKRLKTAKIKEKQRCVNETNQN